MARLRARLKEYETVEEAITSATNYVQELEVTQQITTFVRRKSCALCTFPLHFDFISTNIRFWYLTISTDKFL